MLGGTPGGSIQEQIVREVGAWDGVTVLPHRFGGVEFRVGRRELGHVHGDRLADLPSRRRRIEIGIDHD